MLMLPRFGWLAVVVAAAVVAAAVVVPAQADDASVPVTVVAAHPADGSAALDSLQFDGLDSLAFSHDRFRYELDAPAGVSETTVTAGTAEPDATVEIVALRPRQAGQAVLDVDYDDADANEPGHQVQLAEDGDTLVMVRVASGDGLSQSLYVVLIARPADAASPALSALRLTGASLDPEFAAGTLVYRASAEPDVAEVTVDPDALVASSEPVVVTVWSAAPDAAMMRLIVPAYLDSGAIGWHVALGGPGSETVIVVIVADSAGRINSYATTVQRAQAEIVAPAPADDRPAPVTGVEAQPGDNAGELVVSWDAHPDGPPDPYRIAIAPVDGSYVGGEWGGGLGASTDNTFAHGTSTTVTGLTPGTEYKVIIRARFAGARPNSEWSAEATGFAAELVRPAAVTGVTAGPGGSAGELVVAWDAHPDDPPDPYRIVIAPVGGDYVGGQWGGGLGAATDNTFAYGTETVIEGLSPGVGYKVMVRARFAGARPNSEWSAEATGFAAELVRPAAVTGVTAGPGGNAGELVVAWDAHPDDPPDPYRIVIAPVGGDYVGGQWGGGLGAATDNTFAYGTETVIEGLSPGVEYKVMVRARFARVKPNSEWSAEATGFAAAVVRRVWSGSVSLGAWEVASPPIVAYSRYGGGANGTKPVGGVSPGQFSVDGVDYYVRQLMELGGGLTLGLSGELPFEFTLSVNGEQFSSVNSFVESLARAPGGYWWPAPGLGWAAGDVVAVSIDVHSSPKADRSPAPPAAYFTDVAESHNGIDEVTMRLVFHEAGLAVDAAMLRDAALGVVGGSVTDVAAVPRNRRAWDITVQPTGTGTVTVALAAAVDCAQPAAVCAPDGRGLRHRAGTTIPGPPGKSSALDSLRFDGLDPPGFSPDRHRYQLNAPDGLSQTTVTTTTAEPDATVDFYTVRADDMIVDGTDADHREPGYQVRLSEDGDTLMLVRVTSSDTTSQQFFSTLLRGDTATDSEAPNGASLRSFSRSTTPKNPITPRNGDDGPALASLSLGDATLDPAFDPAVFMYDATAPHDSQYVTVTAEANVSDGDVIVVPVDADDAEGHQVEVGAPGTTTAIVIVVSDSNGRLNSYIISMQRQAPPTTLKLIDTDTDEQEELTEFIDMDAGSGHACALRANGQIVCWGTVKNHDTVRPAVSPDPSNRYTQVVAGRYGSCGLLEGGSIDCFDAAYMNPGEDVLPANAVVAQISLHSHHLCWLLEDGSIGCDRPAIDLDMPDFLAGESFSFVGAGALLLSCGLRTAGTVVCWDHFPESNSLDWSPGGEFTSISFGGNIGCGIKADSTVSCWASSWGDTSEEYSMRPGPRPSPSGTFTQVDSGYWVSCGVRTDQSVECWSNRPEHWVGYTDPVEDLTPPEGSFTKVSVAFWHFACGLKTDGSVLCWGEPEHETISGIYNEPSP